jgi:hypothetical protein
LFHYIVPPGQRDGLITPPLDLTGFDQVYINFQHAYAKRYSGISDSLIVYISGDCGNTWTRIFNGGDNGTGNFATTYMMTEEFIPDEPDDWCGVGWGSQCNEIDISAWAGLRGVKIKFESYSYLGNNIYIDNFSISSPVSVINRIPNEPDILIFPNPTTGIVDVYFQNMEGKVTLRVFDLTGRVVYEVKTDLLTDKVREMDLSSLEKGVYFIEVAGKQSGNVKRLIKQ